MRFPFRDCVSVACRIAGAADFDDDGRSELVVRTGRDAGSTYWRAYRLGPLGIVPLGFSDLPRFPELDPPFAVFGGARESGFACKARRDGSRAVLAWHPARGGGRRVTMSVFRLDGDVLELVGERKRTLSARLLNRHRLCH